MLKSLSIYCEKNILKIGLYGFMCGMSLLLSGNTINFWLASAHIDAKIIGLFAFIAMPYVFKFLMAIFINHHKIFWLSNKIGNHKAWLLLAQLMLTFCLIGISFLNPQQDLWLIAVAGFLIAFFAVIQDIIFNSNRIKILDSYLQPAGTATYSIGYRLGTLLSGAGVIFASTYISWSFIYIILASIYALLTIAIICFYSDTKKLDQKLITNPKSNSWYDVFIGPFQDFLASKNFIWIIAFLLLYRLADNMLMIMLNPFLLQIGYNAAEIAAISKSFGIIMVILGGIISGPVITKLGIRTSLITFSFIHVCGYMLFILLNIIGKNIPLLYFITAYEALTGGMMMTAYLSFISSLCKGKHTATQYALLSSGMGLSRVIFPAASGVIVDYYGWMIFFIIIAFLSIITTIFTYLIPKKLFL